MFKLRRPLSVIISLLMLFAVCGSVFADEAEPVTFTVSAPESVHPGEAFTVAIDIGGGDYLAHSLFFTVKYNSEIFTFNSIAPGQVWNALPMDSMKMPNTAVPGMITVGILCPTEPFTGHGTLLYIDLTANDLCTDSSEFTISISDFFYSEVGNEMNAVYLDHVDQGCTVAVFPEPQGMLGDLDGDGQVTFLDVTVLQLFLTGEGGIEDQYLPFTDFNCDGVTTYADISDMTLFLMG